MEVRNHHSPRWCDSSPEGRGKDSRAKRRAMNALHISQGHGNRLGMLGETAQPVCHHTPHDRSSINPFHLRKEVERWTFTPMQSWRGGSSQPLLLSPPQSLHPALRCANITMHRILLQPLQSDDIPALWNASGPMSSIFLVRLLRRVLLHSPIYLTFLMFWQEPGLCTQLLLAMMHWEWSFHALPGCQFSKQCVCLLATAQITAHCSHSSYGDKQDLPGSQQKVLGRQAAGTGWTPVPLQIWRLSLCNAWKMHAALSLNKTKSTLKSATALEQVESEPDGMPSHNSLWGFKYLCSEKWKSQKKNLTISPEIRMLGEEKRKRTLCFYSFSGIPFQFLLFFLTFN